MSSSQSALMCAHYSLHAKPFQKVKCEIIELYTKIRSNVLLHFTFCIQHMEYMIGRIYLAITLPFTLVWKNRWKCFGWCLHSFVSVSHMHTHIHRYMYINSGTHRYTFVHPCVSIQRKVFIPEWMKDWL